MQFYNLKTRSHVDVPEGDVHKMKMVRPTKNGEQTRYAFTAQHEGQKLFKFVSEKAYMDSSAKEAVADAKPKADAKKDTKTKETKTASKSSTAKKK